MMTGKLSSGDNFPFLDAEFQRMAAELAEALVRVEAVWADRFNPSWTIFIASPSIIFYEWSQSIIAGLVSGLATEPEPATGLRLLAGYARWYWRRAFVFIARLRGQWWLDGNSYNDGWDDEDK